MLGPQRARKTYNKKQSKCSPYTATILQASARIDLACTILHAYSTQPSPHNTPRRLHSCCTRTLICICPECSIKKAWIDCRCFGGTAKNSTMEHATTARRTSLYCHHALCTWEEDGGQDLDTGRGYVFMTGLSWPQTELLTKAQLFPH